MVLVGLIFYYIFQCQTRSFTLVLFGLVLYYYFQYPTRKFLNSTKFWEFWELKYKIFNSGIPVSFSGLRRDGKWPVLNGRELDGMGSGWSQVLRMENFPDFFKKNPVPGKGHSGSKTPTTKPIFTMVLAVVTGALLKLFMS